MKTKWEHLLLSLFLNSFWKTMVLEKIVKIIHKHWKRRSKIIIISRKYHCLSRKPMIINWKSTMNYLFHIIDYQRPQTWIPSLLVGWLPIWRPLWCPSPIKIAPHALTLWPRKRPFLVVLDKDALKYQLGQGDHYRVVWHNLRCGLSQMQLYPDLLTYKLRSRLFKLTLGQKPVIRRTARHSLHSLT